MPPDRDDGEHLRGATMAIEGSDRSFGAPQFDVVLRGYDRRQVDEHLSRLQRVLSRMRADLEAVRGRGAVPPVAGPPVASRPRPTPRPRPDEGRDVVGTFTERMQTILQAAEDEAAEIRSQAQTAARAEQERLAAAWSTARAEEETARASVANLTRQRDAVLADLTRVRGQLEALLSGPTARIAVPSQDATTTAAARRDAGAGHPLPGTPASPDEPTSDAGSGPASEAASDVGAAESTAVVALSDLAEPPEAEDVREEAPEPDAEPEAAPEAGPEAGPTDAAESTAVVAPVESPAERTVVVSPADVASATNDTENGVENGVENGDHAATAAPTPDDTVRVSASRPR